MMTSQMVFKLTVVTGDGNSCITNFNEAVTLVGFGPHGIQTFCHMNGEDFGEDMRLKVDREFERFTETSLADVNSTSI